MKKENRIKRKDEIQNGNIIQFDDGSNDIVIVKNKIYSEDNYTKGICFIEWEKISGEGTFDKGKSMIDEFIPVYLTAELLEKCEGVKVTKGSIIHSYAFNMPATKNQFKELSVQPQLGNQYIYVREGQLASKRHDDDVVCIYNADYMGRITLHYFQNLYRCLLHKNLVINLKQ